MPDGIAGDQSPPSDRFGPTFRDIYSFVEYVMRVGTRACVIATMAPWLLDIYLVEERACSRKRSNKVPGVIETKDREIGACELLRDIAVAALPEYPDEGPRAIGEAQGYRNAPLARRYLGAAEARGNTSGKAWQQERRRPTIDAIADVLYRSIYAPDTVANFALEKEGESQ
ncbi:MAG TPA: hypothetical protein VFY36_05440 [Solirubrobacteraceae bacterium]|nr:hypothetical protein [Solirubrobacteraceae bacterium]